MRSFAVAALLLGAAVATPTPQDFDWDAIASVDPIDEVDIPVVAASAAATTLPYNTATAAAAATSAVFADPDDTSLKRRDTADTAANWRANPQWANDATAASTPSGYNLIFQNANGSSQATFGYMGYATLKSYNVAQCASNCNGIKGCSSFNIYYERDPSSTPSNSNPNPPSITVIKCVYYGGPLLASQATNTGQFQAGFEVAVGGSNGYSSSAIAQPAGYGPAVPLGTAAINAPLDCNGRDPYMGVKIFTTGIFDVGRCTAACSAQSAYNRKYPAANGYFQTCQFVNTYVLYNDSTPVGQYCALYNETWGKAFATNKGQYRGVSFPSLTLSAPRQPD